MPRKSKDPFKGRSILPRAEAEAPAGPALVVWPVNSAAINSPPDASPVEAEEGTTRLSFTFKIPGFGRLKIDRLVRFFRRRK
jgi:hypothetical protein